MTGGGMTTNDLVERWWLSLRIAQREIRIYRRSVVARKGRATQRAHPKVLYWRGRPLNYAVARRLRRRFYS